MGRIVIPSPEAGAIFILKGTNSVSYSPEGLVIENENLSDDQLRELFEKDNSTYTSPELDLLTNELHTVLCKESHDLDNPRSCKYYYATPIGELSADVAHWRGTTVSILREFKVTVLDVRRTLEDIKNLFQQAPNRELMRHFLRMLIID